MFNKKIISFPKPESFEVSNQFFLIWYRLVNHTAYKKTLAETFLKAHGFTNVNDTVNGKTSLEIAIAEDKSLDIIKELFHIGFDITKARANGGNSALYELLYQKINNQLGMVWFVVNKIYENLVSSLCDTKTFTFSDCSKILEVERIATALIRMKYPNFAISLALKLLNLPLPIEGIVSAKEIGCLLLANNFHEQALFLAKKIFSHPNGMEPIKNHNFIPRRIPLNIGWMGEIFAVEGDIEKVIAVIDKLHKYRFIESHSQIIRICTVLHYKGHSELAKNIERLAGERFNYRGRL